MDIRFPAIVPQLTFQYRDGHCDENSDEKEHEKRRKATFGKDRRRKHHHWLVRVYYADGEKFGRVYTDKDKADALRGAAAAFAGGEVGTSQPGFLTVL